MVPLSSGGLAGPFSAFVGCFNYIDAGRRYEYDCEILIAMFYIHGNASCDPLHST